MILLSEVIQQLRFELEEARRVGDDATLRFGLGPIELEVSVALERGAGAGAKVRFWVLELDAKAAQSSTTTQRIRLMLTPEVSGGAGTVYVGGESESAED